MKFFNLAAANDLMFIRRQLVELFETDAINMKPNGGFTDIARQDHFWARGSLHQKIVDSIAEEISEVDKQLEELGVEMGDGAANGARK